VGITLGVTSLTSYISRIRHRESANRRFEGSITPSCGAVLGEANSVTREDCSSIRLHLWCQALAFGLGKFEPYAK
jgi:hypothetical protein